MTVAHLFDERNVAVQRMVQLAIAAAKKCARKIGICGQAPATILNNLPSSWLNRVLTRSA